MALAHRPGLLLMAVIAALEATAAAQVAGSTCEGSSKDAQIQQLHLW
jgi:hypothetical protein